MAPLTAAEKQRRYKEKLKLNPEKYEEYKRKKRENYHKKKILVNDLNAKEKFNARTIWKLRKREQRQKKKNLNCITDVTPPSSPSILESFDVLDNNIALRNNTPPLQNKTPPVEHTSAKKERGRKKVIKNRSKLFKDNLKLKDDIKYLKKKCEKYKKRYYRTERKQKPKKEPKPDEKQKYKKLTNAIKERYQRIKNRKEQRQIKLIFENIEGSAKEEIIKESLGIQGQMRTSVKNEVIPTVLMKTIYDFFVRDDISRATAGKKETITKAQTKVQKRFLLDNMKNLFKAFKKEKPNTKGSYSYFAKNRPFFVLKPSVDGREMCLCRLHINPVYKAQALKKRRVINTDDLNVLISSTVCDTEHQACMYGICNECGNKIIQHDATKDSETVKWFEWGRKEEIYEKDGKRIKAVKNVKEVKERRTKDLMEDFNKEMKLLKKHVYNMKIQFKNFREAVNNIQNDEVIVVVDFSENYNCKYHEEIQAHHFGGSRQQVSLHTVVAYISDKESCHKHIVKSYCTISASTMHQPAAIWAHLHPILTVIRLNDPEIKTIHFFSDGPFSQYRQKQNFYFCSTKTFDYGFTAITWSFFEAGHGKGPADGVGGFLKRTADNMVAAGQGIMCAQQFYEALKDMSRIKLFMISQDEIDASVNQLPSKITPLVGTLYVHQVFTSVRGQLQYRNLSCFCKRGFCECLQPKKYQPLAVSNSEENEPRNIFNLVEDLDSSDENIPLCILKSAKKSHLNEINLSHLIKAQPKNIYNLVYSTDSDDDQGPSTSGIDLENKENSLAVQYGDYLLVNVLATKGKIYRYVCIVHNVDDDNDIFVTFLQSVKNNCAEFRLVKTDTSFIDRKDIIMTLKKPLTKVKRGQIYYEFSCPIDVFEQ